MNTFTLITADGTTLETGVSAIDAAQTILSYDGQGYDMRREDGFWCILVKAADGRMVQGWANNKPLHSLAETEAEAWAEIAPKVIHHDWPRHPVAMTDADFAAMRAAD